MLSAVQDALHPPPTCCCRLGATELLCAHNSSVYVVLVKKRDPKGRLPDPKLICLLHIHAITALMETCMCRELSFWVCTTVRRKSGAGLKEIALVVRGWVLSVTYLGEAGHRHTSSCSRCGKNRMVDYTLWCMCWNKGNVERCIFCANC
jgi:hypothetical protein